MADGSKFITLTCTGATWHSLSYTCSWDLNSSDAVPSSITWYIDGSAYKTRSLSSSATYDTCTFSDLSESTKYTIYCCLTVSITGTGLIDYDSATSTMKTDSSSGGGSSGNIKLSTESLGAISSNQNLTVSVSSYTVKRYSMIFTSSGTAYFNSYSASGIWACLSDTSDYNVDNCLPAYNDRLEYDYSASGNVSFSADVTDGIIYYLYITECEDGAGVDCQFVITPPTEAATEWSVANWKTSQNISELKTFSTSLSSGEVYRIKLTFAQSGNVDFYSYHGSYDTIAYLSDSTSFDSNTGEPTTILETDDQGGDDDHFRFSYSVEANTTYYLFVRLYYITASSDTFYIAVNPTWAWSVVYRDTVSNLSGTYEDSLTIESQKVYRYAIGFATSGTATFYSTGSIDTNGYLSTSSTFDSDNGTPSSPDTSDDDSGDSLNFKITYEVEANVVYYLFVRGHSDSTTGDIGVVIEAPASSYGSAEVTFVSSTTNSITVKIVGLDTRYTNSDRKVYWYCSTSSTNTSMWGSSSLSGGISESDIYTFSGLSTSTTYYIYAKIITSDTTKTLTTKSFETIISLTGISVSLLDKTGTTITTKVTGLDSSYSRADRTVKWYLDGTLKTTVSLGAGITETPTYQFTGLSPYTAYTVKATISYTENGTTKTKDVSSTLRTANWASQSMSSISMSSSAKTVTWTIKKNYLHYATVTFSTAGTFTISASNSYGSYGYLSTGTNFNNNGGTPSSYVNSGYGSSGFSFSHSVSAGDTYYLFVRNGQDASGGSVTISFSAPLTWSVVSAGSYANIKVLNQMDTLSISAGKVYRYTLTFANSGQVKFYSSGSMDVRAYLGTVSTISSSTGIPTSYLITHDDISDTDKNFSFTYTVSAGTTYYLFVKHANSITATGSTTVYVDPTNKPTKFSWTTAKVQGEEFNLTATEWNALLDKINEMRTYQAAKTGKSISTWSFYTVTSGTTFYAKYYNDVLDSMDSVRIKLGLGSIANDYEVSSGDPITAVCLNHLVTMVNELIDS